MSVNSRRRGKPPPSIASEINTTLNGCCSSLQTAASAKSASLNLGDGLVVGGYGPFLIDHLRRGLDVRLPPNPYPLTPNPNP